MFSNKTKFWLMFAATLLMGYFTFEALEARNYLWAVLMGIFTYFNLDQTIRLHKYSGGIHNIINFRKEEKAFHQTRKFKDLD